MTHELNNNRYSLEKGKIRTVQCVISETAASDGNSYNVLLAINCLYGKELKRPSS